MMTCVYSMQLRRDSSSISSSCAAPRMPPSGFLISCARLRISSLLACSARAAAPRARSCSCWSMCAELEQQRRVARCRSATTVHVQVQLRLAGDAELELLLGVRRAVAAARCDRGAQRRRVAEQSRSDAARACCARQLEQVLRGGVREDARGRRRRASAPRSASRSSRGRTRRRDGWPTDRRRAQRHEAHACAARTPAMRRCAVAHALGARARARRASAAASSLLAAPRCCARAAATRLSQLGDRARGTSRVVAARRRSGVGRAVAVVARAARPSSFSSRASSSLEHLAAHRRRARVCVVGVDARKAGGVRRAARRRRRRARRGACRLPTVDRRAATRARSPCRARRRRRRVGAAPAACALADRASVAARGAAQQREQRARQRMAGVRSASAALQASAIAARHVRRSVSNPSLAQDKKGRPDGLSLAACTPRALRPAVYRL